MVALSRPRWRYWLAINILNSTKTLKGFPTNTNHHKSWSLFYHDLSKKNPKKAKESFRNQRTLSMKHSMDITICFTASRHRFTHLPSVHQSSPGALAPAKSRAQITRPVSLVPDKNWSRSRHPRNFFETLEVFLFKVVRCSEDWRPSAASVQMFNAPPRTNKSPCNPNRPRWLVILQLRQGQKTMSSKEGNKLCLASCSHQQL